MKHLDAVLATVLTLSTVFTGCGPRRTPAVEISQAPLADGEKSGSTIFKVYRPPADASSPEQVRKDFAVNVSKLSWDNVVVIGLKTPKCDNDCNMIARNFFSHASGSGQKTVVVSVDIEEIPALAYLANGVPAPLEPGKKVVRLPQYLVMREGAMITNYIHEVSKIPLNDLYDGVVHSYQAGIHCNAEHPPKQEGVKVCHYVPVPGGAAPNLAQFAASQSIGGRFAAVHFSEDGCLNCEEITSALADAIAKKGKSGVVIDVGVENQLGFGPVANAWYNGSGGGVDIIASGIHQHDAKKRPSMSPKIFADMIVGEAERNKGFQSLREILGGRSIPRLVPDPKSGAVSPQSVQGPDPSMALPAGDRPSAVPLTEDMIDRTLGRQKRKGILPPEP